MPFIGYYSSVAYQAVSKTLPKDVILLLLFGPNCQNMNPNLQGYQHANLSLYPGNCISRFGIGRIALTWEGLFCKALLEVRGLKW